MFKETTITTTIATLSDYHLKFISEFIYRRTGIVLGERKRYLIESRLLKVARIVGLASITHLCQELATNNPQSITLVVDALTTNETFWFRDERPFDALQNVVFPAIARNNRAKTLRILSAPCSTGQEPYSIAMLILESGLFANCHIKIIAIDISTEALRQAKQGVYSQMEINRGLPVKYLIKYFTQISEVWKIKAEVKRMVTFFKQPLHNNSLPAGPFDLIFCRNLLIYFDLETKCQILSNISRSLESNGFLILGGAESTLNISSLYQPIRIQDTTFYAKNDQSIS